MRGALHQPRVTTPLFNCLRQNLGNLPLLCCWCPLWVGSGLKSRSTGQIWLAGHTIIVRIQLRAITR